MKMCTPDDLLMGFWLGVVISIALVTFCVGLYFILKEPQ